MLVYLKSVKAKVGKVVTRNHVYGRVVINLPKELIGNEVNVIVYADVFKGEIFKK